MNSDLALGSTVPQIPQCRKLRGFDFWFGIYMIFFGLALTVALVVPAVQVNLSSLALLAEFVLSTLAVLITGLVATYVIFRRRHEKAIVSQKEMIDRIVGALDILQVNLIIEKGTESELTKSRALYYFPEECHPYVELIFKNNLWNRK